jgi:hypothetical protein
MTEPDAAQARTVHKRQAWLRRGASPLVAATIVVTTINWPGLGVADQANYLAAATGLGFVLGASWQLAARRDLADRLLLLAFLAIATGVLPLLIQDVDYRPATAHAALAMVAGLVLAEQWLRWRRPNNEGQ